MKEIKSYRKKRKICLMKLNIFFKLNKNSSDENDEKYKKIRFHLHDESRLKKH